MLKLLTITLGVPALPISREALWSFLFSAVVAIATAAYALLTWRLVAETRRMREAATQPHVGVSVLPSEYAPVGFADLVIRNYGSGPALDVTFRPEEATPAVADATILDELHDLGIVKNGIPYLAPGAEFRLYYAQLLGRSDQELATNIHIRVKYVDLNRRQYEMCYPLELGHFAKRMRIGHPPLQEIGRELKRLREEVEQIRAAIQSSGSGNST
jgi:hypothetical protein